MVFARKVVKQTKSQFMEDPGGLRVWGPNTGDSLCANNRLSELYFGENLISGCFIRLEESQLQRCQDLVASIWNVQKMLVRSLYVARGGDYNLTL